jgi:hypothetical protein
MSRLHAAPLFEFPVFPLSLATLRERIATVWIFVTDGLDGKKEAGMICRMIRLREKSSD